MKKELKKLHNPSVREIVIVDVPKMNFLMRALQNELPHLLQKIWCEVIYWLYQKMKRLRVYFLLKVEFEAYWYAFAP